MGGRCFRLSSSLPNFNKAGPSIQKPKLLTGGRALMRAISSFKMSASSAFNPAPPYSGAQVGAVQPFSTIRSSHTRCAVELNCQRRPPQQCSSMLVIGSRIYVGQFFSSQARVSNLNSFRGDILTTMLLLELGFI